MKALDFIIDDLTNSIRNIISGDSFSTEVSCLGEEEIKNITKKKGWKFNWKQEFSDSTCDVYKLTIVHNPKVIQGLVSLRLKSDHIEMRLLESAPFNVGKNKVYEGVAGNLVAYACKLSFQQGFEGFTAFLAKTKLISHYIKTLGAVHIGGQQMIIDENAAKLLVGKYFKD